MATKKRQVKHENTGKPKRDERGRLLPGYTANPNGRPRGYDFRAEVEKHAQENGVSISDALWQVFQAMLRKACDGDVQAAKLIIDKLCDSPDHIHVTYDGDVSVVHDKLPEDPVKLREWVNRLNEMVNDGKGKRRRA